MRSSEAILGHSGSFKVNFQMCLISFETHWKASRLASWMASSNPKWPQMTSNDLFMYWIKYLLNHSPKSVMVVVENSPSQFGALNLNITWLGHVTKKPIPPLNSLGAKYPVKRFKLISWELSKTQNVETYCFAQILRDWRSLKCSYLFMVVVGGALIGLVGCAKITSFILDWCRHRTLSNTLEISCFLRNSWFLKKIMVFRKIFLAQKIRRKILDRVKVSNLK